MPANDGTTRVWFSILTPDEETGAIDITLHHFGYDHAAAAQAIHTVTPNLPYAETLEDGLWPNMSVLPKPERQQQGRPLDPRPVVWTPSASAVAAE